MGFEHIVVNDIIFGNGVDYALAKIMERAKANVAGEQAAGLGIKEIMERFSVSRGDITRLRLLKKLMKLTVFLASCVEVPWEIVANKGARLQFQAQT